MVAAMLGGLSADQALTVARTNFRVIAFDKLYTDDFKENGTSINHDRSTGKAKGVFARALTKAQDRNGARTREVALG